MFELTMITPDGNKMPSLLLDEPDDFADFHLCPSSFRP